MAAPRKRTYRCEQCDRLTVVDGFRLYQICNPFAFCMGSTVCVSCGPVDMGKVRWKNTGETLRDYRVRGRGRRPWLWGAYLLAPVGAWVGWAFGPQIGGELGPTGDRIVNAFMGMLIGTVLAALLAPALYHLTTMKDPRRAK